MRLVSRYRLWRSIRRPSIRKHQESAFYVPCRQKRRMPNRCIPQIRRSSISVANLRRKGLENYSSPPEGFVRSKTLPIVDSASSNKDSVLSEIYPSQPYNSIQSTLLVHTNLNTSERGETGKLSGVDQHPIFTACSKSDSNHPRSDWIDEFSVRGIVSSALDLPSSLTSLAPKGVLLTVEAFKGNQGEPFSVSVSSRSETVADDDNQNDVVMRDERGNRIISGNGCPISNLKSFNLSQIHDEFDERLSDAVSSYEGDFLPSPSTTILEASSSIQDVFRTTPAESCEAQFTSCESKFARGVADEQFAERPSTQVARMHELVSPTFGFTRKVDMSKSSLLINDQYFTERSTATLNYESFPGLHTAELGSAQLQKSRSPLVTAPLSPVNTAISYTRHNRTISHPSLSLNARPSGASLRQCNFSHRSIKRRLDRHRRSKVLPSAVRTSPSDLPSIPSRSVLPRDPRLSIKLTQGCFPKTDRMHSMLHQVKRCLTPYLLQ